MNDDHNYRLDHDMEYRKLWKQAQKRVKIINIVFGTIFIIAIGVFIGIKVL